MQSADSDARARRTALVDALSGEHRLRRQARKEQQEAARWTQRAVFAEERGLADLAAGAQARSSRHTRMAEALLAHAEEIRAEAQWLRESLDATRGAGRAPPDALDRQFADLEIEMELEELRKARPSDSQTDEPSTASVNGSPAPGDPAD